MSLSPFRFVEVGVKEVWLITIGEIGIPRATVLCIRSKFGLFERREVVGMGAALVWETIVCGIKSAPSHEGGII